jgi:hypothetical protein
MPARSDARRQTNGSKKDSGASDRASGAEWYQHATPGRPLTRAAAKMTATELDMVIRP